MSSGILSSKKFLASRVSILDLLIQGSLHHRPFLPTLGFLVIQYPTLVEFLLKMRLSLLSPQLLTSG